METLDVVPLPNAICSGIADISFKMLKNVHGELAALLLPPSMQLGETRDIF
jgi:hypothetical protein